MTQLCVARLSGSTAPPSPSSREESRADRRKRLDRRKQVYSNRALARRRRRAEVSVHAYAVDATSQGHAHLHAAREGRAKIEA